LSLPPVSLAGTVTNQFDYLRSWWQCKRTAVRPSSAPDSRDHGAARACRSGVSTLWPEKNLVITPSWRHVIREDAVFRQLEFLVGGVAMSADEQS